jgi:hypothetical protein
LKQNGSVVFLQSAFTKHWVQAPAGLQNGAAVEQSFALRHETHWPLGAQNGLPALQSEFE